MTRLDVIQKEIERLNDKLEQLKYLEKILSEAERNVVK